MKRRLTKEQSAHLIEIGVSPHKASEIELYPDPVSQWTGNGAPIFTFCDVIELLPATIYSEEREIDYSPFQQRRIQIGSLLPSSYL